MTIEIRRRQPSPQAYHHLWAERHSTVALIEDNYFAQRRSATEAVTIRINGAEAGYALVEERVEAKRGIFAFYLRRGDQRLLRQAWAQLAQELEPGYIILRSDDPLAMLLCADLGLTFKPDAYVMERERTFRLNGRPGWEIVPLTHDRFDEAFAILAPESPWEGGHSVEEGEAMRASIGTPRYHLALVDGVVAGVGMLNPLEERPNVVDIGMVIAKPFRRMGLASWLLSHLATDAEERGCALVAGLGAHNTGSRRSLEKAGFRVAFAWSTQPLPLP